MEYLDYYDEEGNYLGFETRDVIHREGLWHKTVQNWLYTMDGKIIFQIRKDSEKFYTSSSGHVDKGETLEEALVREMNEELGIIVDPKDAKIIDHVTWVMDKVKSNGFVLKDRAKSTFFLIPYRGDCSDFSFDPEEVLGVVFVDARETLEMFEKNKGKIDAMIVQTENGENVKIYEKVSIEDFLVLPGENAYDKYGKVLKSAIEATTVNI